MKGGIVSVIFGFIMWKVTGNIFIGAIIAVVLTPLLEGTFNAIIRSISMIGVKSPDFITLKEIDLDDPAVKGKGLRVLLLTNHTVFDENDPQSMDTYKKIYAYGAQKLYDSDPKFKSRYKRVQEKQQPVRVCATVCDVSKAGKMNKCYSVWLKIMDSESFYSDPDNDMFVEDIQYKDPKTNQTQNAGVVFAFRRGLVLNSEIPAVDPEVVDVDVRDFSIVLDKAPVLLQV